MHECFREAEMDEKEEIKSQERHHGDGKKEENEEHLGLGCFHLRFIFAFSSFLR